MGREKSHFRGGRTWLIVFFCLLLLAGVGLVLIGSRSKGSREEALLNVKVASGANVSIWRSQWLTELLLRRSPTIRSWAQLFASVHEFHTSGGANGMTDEEMGLLTAFPELRQLNLSAATITDAGLGKISGLRNLKVLSIRDTGVTDDGLTNVARFRKLEELYLQKSKVRGAGLSNLAGLKELKVLRLDGLPIRDEDLRWLVGLTKLEKLDLGQTEVSGEGLRHLAGLTNLRSLSFTASDHLRSEGLKHLLPLYGGERDGGAVRELLLGWTGVDDSAVETLKEFRALAGLNLKSTKISGADLRELEKALAGTTVEYYANQLRN